MSSNIKLINNEDASISIVNLHWNEYRQIMLAMEATCCLLDNTIEDDFYYDEERKRLAKQYNTLFKFMKESGIPYKGIGISIDDTVIEKCLK